MEGEEEGQRDRGTAIEGKGQVTFRTYRKEAS